EMAELASSLHEEPSTQATIESIVEHTKSAVGASHAGILFLRRPGQIETMSASDEIVRSADAIQMRLGEGPDLSLFDGAESIIVDDTLDEKRWPRWAEAVADL